MGFTQQMHSCPNCGQEWIAEKSEYCPECETHYGESPGNLPDDAVVNRENFIN